MLLALCAIVGAQAQNANRKGFFVEAAIGGSIGPLPVAGLSIENDKLIAHYAGGAMLNIAFGPRFRTGDHTAFEFRVEAQASTSLIPQSLVLKAMPGIRVTTGEVFRNMSVYFNANLGGAIADSGIVPYSISYITTIVPSNGEIMHWDLYGVRPSLGIAYEVSTGLNVTTHLYAGVVWSAQYMFLQIHNALDRESLHQGMAAFRVGYRF